MRIFSFLSLTLLFLCACSRTDLKEYQSNPKYQIQKSSKASHLLDRRLKYGDLNGNWEGTDLYNAKVVVKFGKLGYSIWKVSDERGMHIIMDGHRDKIAFYSESFKTRELIDKMSYQVYGVMQDYNTLNLNVDVVSNTTELIFNSSHSYILKRSKHKDLPLSKKKRSPTDPPPSVYRRDFRDPEEIFQNGFRPRGSNDDLIAHVSGVSLYFNNVSPSGWISTTASFPWARRPISPVPNDEFWVYTITPGPNTYSVNSSFEHYLNTGSTSRDPAYLQRLISMYGDQQEWAVLGSIPADRIRRATHFRFDRQRGEYAQGEIRENPGYDRGSVPSASPSPYIPFTVSVPNSRNSFFRADRRIPEQVVQTLGIVADDAVDTHLLNWGIDADDINLYRHSRGPNRDGYGYLSVSSTLSAAHLMGTSLFGLTRYYIYVLAVAPNIFHTSEILGQYRNRDNQYSILGGIPLQQIIGWFPVVDGHIVGEMTDNPSYRSGLFNGLGIIEGETGYPFAGFPLGHEAWTRHPWSEHAPDFCIRTDFRRSANVVSWCDKHTHMISRDYLLLLQESWRGGGRPR